MKLASKKEQAAIPYNVKIGEKRDLRVKVRNGVIEAPAWTAEILAKEGFTPVEGEVAGDLRSELGKAAPHELATFLNAYGHDVHYWEALEHPMSTEAIQAGLPHIADELDRLYERFHHYVTKGRGMIKLASDDEMRKFALQIHDYKEKGLDPPECPWSPQARAKARLARKK